MNDQLKQLHQVTSDLVKEIKNIAKDMKVVKADSQKNQGAIDLVVKEVNRMMAKKEEAIGCLRLQGKAMREQIDGINKRNCRFEEEVEQKIERIAN